MHFSSHILKTILFLLVLFVAACEEEPQSDANGLPLESHVQAYTDTGDLKQLRQHNKLRILLPRLSADIDYLPRSGLPIHYETELANRFALKIGLEPVWIYVDKFEQLIPTLLSGQGDLIAANFTVTDERKQQLAFTVPIATVKEQLVTRADDQIKELGDLVGREIAVQKSTSFWGTAQKIVRQYPGVQIDVLPEELSVEEIVNAVANRKLDTTIADSNFLSAVLPTLDKIKIPLDVSGERPVAWAVRPNALQLKEALDKFLSHEKLTARTQATYKEDLPLLKERKVLRVLTRNNAATYFLWRGELMGFEYELAREFARRQGMRVEMIVAPTRQDLFTWLREGRGDMIAANLTILPEREAQGIRYSRGYNTVKEVVVTRKNDDSLKTLADLQGRTVYVRPSSSYWRTLAEMVNQGMKIKLVAVPESMETEDIIEKVADGDYDVTIADSHIVDVELSWRDDEIKVAFELEGVIEHGWVVREDSPLLLNAVNTFIKKEYKGLFYNLAKQKYFQKPEQIKQRLEERVDTAQGGKLSPYDPLAKRYAEQYGFDWRLIVSQMYQESRFDPKAESWAGALGLMQILPRTAKELGEKNLRRPENGIRAGIKYLDWLRDRFEPELAVKDRMWFVLASFNAGVGHVKDARRLAKKLGLNPNRWFNNVEKAMLLLSRREHATKAQHGFVRGIEPVNYVRQIRDRYEAYVRLTSG